MNNPTNRNDRNRTGRMAFRLMLIVWAVLGMSVFGCREDYPLAGYVTVDGEVIQNGTILFRPDEEAGNSGPSSTTRIVNGRFLLPAGQKFTSGPTIAEITDRDRPEVKFVARFDFPDSPTENFEIQAQPTD